MLSLRQASILGLLLVWTLHTKSWLPKKPSKLSNCKKFEIESGYGGIIPNSREIAQDVENRNWKALLGFTSIVTASALLDHGFHPADSFEHQLNHLFANFESHFQPQLTTNLMPSTGVEKIDEKSPLVQALDALRDATVMPDIDSRLAIEVAENAVARIIGGASAAVALRGELGSLCSCGSSCFREFLSIMRKVTGIPRPVAILVASMSGAALSIFSRRVQKEICRVQAKGRLCCQDSPEAVKAIDDAKEFKISYRNIAADILQWHIYNSLSANFIFQKDEISAGVIHFWFGAIAGILSYGIRPQKQPDNSATQSSECEGEPSTSIAPKGIDIKAATKAAVESGVLFLCFEEILELLRGVVPAELNQKFLFETVIEEIEEEIEEEMDRGVV